MKFISVATTILTLISVIQAQNATASSSTLKSTPSTTVSSNTTLSSGYPTLDTKLIPKPEWIELIKGANITNAPPTDSSGNINNKDQYCDWTSSHCVGTSIADCPKGVWGLAFDEGPSEFSPMLYDFLKTTSQKATFFMNGLHVIKYPDIVKRAYDEGHEIAISSWSYLATMTRLTNEEIVAELKWTELAIKEITGMSPRLFRPPRGDIDNRVRDVGTALGFTSVLWDHKVQDWNASAGPSEFSDVDTVYIEDAFLEWAAEAATATTGGLSVEHDDDKFPIDGAIRGLPFLQKAYTVVTVGQCANLPSYKENNDTLPINIPSATVSSIAQNTITTTANNTNTGTRMCSASAMLASTATLLMSILFLVKMII